MEQEGKITERLYLRYEYLARKYASKIFSYEQLSFEYEDLVQEFRIKIYMAIKSYGKRWIKYRNGEDCKPINIKYYLESACSKKVIDFAKYINRENYKIRIDDIDFDMGYSNETNVSPNENKFIINDIDLLEGLFGAEKLVFILYIKGYKCPILNRILFSKTKSKDKTASEIIKNQINFLKTKYGDVLLIEPILYSSYEKD